MSGLARRLMGCLPAEVTAVPADSIDFDGTNDYLSRGGLIGVAETRTITFSCWVWWNPSTGTPTIYKAGKSNQSPYELLAFDLTGSGQLTVRAYSVSGDTILSFSSSQNLSQNTFHHVLISFDLVNASKRFVYINDQPATGSWSYFVNQTIPLTFAPINEIGRTPVFENNRYFGRLSHLYLDYAYRDLSVEANRRLFITADRKPALNQQALNPILYLPLNDPTQPGKNLGTGGDFALTGVVAKSGRGPSQFNAVYAYLKGPSGTQSLIRGGIAGVTNGTKLTLSICFSPASGTGSNLLCFMDSSRDTFYISWGGNTISVYAYGDGKTVLNVSAAVASRVYGRNNHLVISFDLSDPSKRWITLNGTVLTLTWFTYINAAITLTNSCRIGLDYSSNYYGGEIGNVFFDTKYIDLSQPANLAKFVTGTSIDAKPVDMGANGELPFGTPPLIYLPMYGNNAGKNYGTGGDFTVNSGPFPGARGPNEYWGNKADFDGSTGYLSKSSGISAGNSKTFSFSFHVQFDVLATQVEIFNCWTGAGNGVLLFKKTSGNLFQMIAMNSAGTTVLTATCGNMSTASIQHVVGCIDLENSSKFKLYLNGVAVTTSTSVYTNAEIALSQINKIGVGAYVQSTPTVAFDGKLSEFYFTTDYIDFSQEANRLKFRDAFGNPVDLTPQIEAGTLPTPAIYMRFDPANFGKNSGTGGDFTVNGTITDGGQL